MFSKFVGGSECVEASSSSGATAAPAADGVGVGKAENRCPTLLSNGQLPAPDVGAVGGPADSAGGAVCGGGAGGGTDGSEL